MICDISTFCFSGQPLTKSSTHSGQLNKNDISAPYPQSRNLIEMNNQQTSNARPLPPVPHMNQ